MKKLDLNNIFSESACVEERVLFDYLDNKLSSKDKHNVEKHLAHCEICSDALEGLTLVKNRNILKNTLLDISHAIDKKTFHKERKTISINMPVKLAIAATIAILIGISFLFTHYLRKTQDNFTAENNINNNKDKPLENNLNIPVNSDSEIIKSETTLNKEKLKNTPGKYEKTGEGFGNNSSNKVLLPDAIDKTLADQDRAVTEENVSTKTPIVFSNDLSKTTEVVQPVTSIDSKLNLEEEKNPKIDLDNVSGGISGKDDISGKTIGYKVNEKKKLSKFSDIVEVNTKRKESNAPSAPQQQDNSVVTNEIYNQAVEKFKAKDYTAAKQMFEQILINDKSDYNSRYYKALCLFYLNENDNAIKEFNDLLKIKNGIFSESVKWHKALALIKKGEKKEAKKILQELIDSNSSFNTDAEQKIKEI
jgi:tetratricopeptide (TPR) repeat protein